MQKLERSIVLLGLVLFAAPGLAQVPGTKLPNGAVTPNWTGVWERAQGIRFNPTNELPSFTPAYAARYEKAMAARARGEIVADPTSRCLPQGMPRFMVASYPLEILQTAKQVTIIAEWSSQVRPSVKMRRTWLGHSAMMGTCLAVCRISRG